ncbi:Protein artichoke [Gryllus bimaculatus]|nr:Protein artichoke [Gryllus bimaculatus]
MLAVRKRVGFRGLLFAIELSSRDEVMAPARRSRGPRPPPTPPPLLQLLLAVALCALLGAAPAPARAQENALDAAVGGDADADATDTCPPDSAIHPCRCSMRGDDLQIWCSNSELGAVLEALQRKLPALLSRAVDELILEANLMPALPGRAFAPLRVSRLMLRANALERVAPAWLAGLEDSLLELFVEEPRLRALPVDSLRTSAALEAVTLVAGAMRHTPSFSGLPRLRYLRLQSPSLSELSPTHFRAMPDLETLEVSLSRVCRGWRPACWPTAALRELNVSWCGLAWLHPRALARLPALQSLDLSGNRLADAGVVGRAVRDLPALATLRLDHNLVDRLAEASFVDLPQLRELHLVGNRVMEVERGAFHRVPALRTLDLSANAVRRELRLRNNALVLPEELRAVLAALPRLRFLDASHNLLAELPPGALRGGHAALEQLHLDHNRLRRMGRNAFAAFPALRELRLRNNSLADGPDTFQDMPWWDLPALKVRQPSQRALHSLQTGFAGFPSL